MLILIAFFSCFHIVAQPKNEVAPIYSSTDIEALYSLCKNVPEDSLNRLCLGFLNDHHLRKNRESFLAFCNDFKTYCQKEDNYPLYRRISIIELHGRFRFDKASSQQASKAFEDLHETYIRQRDYAAALECLFELSQFLHRIKDNIGAIQTLFYADKFAKEYNLTNKISYQGILHKTGYIMWELDKPMRSIDYLKKALATGKGITMDSLVALNGIGINYQKLDSLEKSLHYFNMASQTALRAGNNLFNTIVLGSASATLQKMGKLDSAMYYCNAYKNISYRDTLWSNAVEALHRMIQITLQQKNVDRASKLLDSLQALSGKLNREDYISFKRQKESAYNFYTKTNDYKNALSAYKEYVHYDSLFREYSNKNRISELELNAAVRIYEDAMRKKEQARKWRSWLMYGIVALLVIAVGSLAWYSYKKIKRTEKSKQEVERLNQLQASEIQGLKEQLLLQLATIRNHNSSYATLTEKQHTDVLSEEATITELLQQEQDVSNLPNGTELLNEFNLTKKEQWKDFKESFSKMYPDFEQKITTKIGVVSSAELRLMMLHKLGLTNKEIAETLLISSDGVKKGKYRLYKRIGIGSAEELSNFLQ